MGGANWYSRYMFGNKWSKVMCEKLEVREVQTLPERMEEVELVKWLFKGWKVVS